MNLLKSKLSAHPPVIWSMLTATGLTRVTQFMVMPFMALYMGTHTSASASIIGLAIGCNALVSTAFSFVGGSLSDRFGRKFIMAMAMLLNALAMAGFANARHVWLFFLIGAVSGLSRSLYDPASQAMITDLTAPDKRAGVFAMSYWVTNVGASIGPILGAYFGTVSTGWTFYTAAVVELLYAILIFATFPESKPSANQSSISTAEIAASAGLERTSFSSTVRTIGLDKALQLFILASVFTSLGYSQLETTLPQFMNTLMGHSIAARDYAIVIGSNGIEVVLLQLVINRISGRWGIVRPFMICQFLYFVSFIGFAFSRTLLAFLLWMFVLTIGEVLASPRMGEYIARLANDEMRGAYFGASAFSNLGFFLGPWLGGIILHWASGRLLFLIVAAIALVAAPVYKWSYQSYQKARAVFAIDEVNRASYDLME